jgi:Pentapeptide repeats (8 copies)
MNPTPGQSEFLQVLWQSLADDGTYYPLRLSDVIERVNRLRTRRGLPKLAATTVSVTFGEMREKKLVKVFRLLPEGPEEQVSAEAIATAIAKRDQRTAYGPAIDPPENLADERWLMAEEAFLRELNAPLFQEDFNLPKVFVDPLGYWTELVQVTEEPTDDVRKPKPLRHEVRHVQDARQELHAWLRAAMPKDHHFVLEGEPGAGKSSLARMLCADILTARDSDDELAKYKFAFVPLYDLNHWEKAEVALDEFAAKSGYPNGMLDLDSEVADLLVVLDGLDELRHADGHEKDNNFGRFVDKICRQAERCRDRGRNVRLLFCGRPIAVAQQKDIPAFTLLPFFLPEDARPTKADQPLRYQSETEALAHDRRQDWWQKFEGGEMPTAIAQIDTELTAQPLLLTLMAIAYRHRDDAENAPAGFTPPANPFAQDEPPERMADVYAWLLWRVYHRDAVLKKAALGSLGFAEFRELLALIGLATWHGGDSRSTTIDQVERLAKLFKKTKLLKDYETKFRGGLVGLFLTFFFRHAESVGGQHRFLFTIKPFAEYLTAVGLTMAMDVCQKRLGQRKGDDSDDDVYTAEDLADFWLQATGQGLITQDLFDHFLNEVTRRAEQEHFDLMPWQKALKEVFEHTLANGFPLRSIALTTSFAVAETSRRAEHALLCALGNTVQTPPTLPVQDEEESEEEFAERWDVYCREHLLNLTWPKETESISARRCIHRLRLPETREDWWEPSSVPLRMVGWNLSWANLRGANLSWANLSGANLSWANLIEANLSGANLIEANLIEANLSWANLSGANLSGANLRGANLSRANLSGANLRGANLIEANLSGANLRGANLRGANLRGANLRGANLRGANLRGANLRDATYDGHKLDTEEGREFLRSIGAKI